MPVKNVEELGRCSQCGICQVVCNNIHMTDTGPAAAGLTGEFKNRDYLVRIQDQKQCETCQSKRCLQVCPSNHPAGFAESDGLFSPGPLETIFAGHSRNPSIRKHAASGGFITGFLSYLLEQGLADGAVVVAPDPDDPRKGRFKLVAKAEELLGSASSIYSMVPLQKDLARLLRTTWNKKLVFVGRPCQINALERARRLLPALDKALLLTISVFCAWSISRQGLDFLMRMSGLAPGEPVGSLHYRHGLWPGNFSVFSQGKEKRFPYFRPDHFKGVYYYPLLTGFVPKECTRCPDVLGSGADIAVGDAWNLGLKPITHGYSLVLCRTPRAAVLLQDGAFAKTYFVVDRECSPTDLETSQGNTVKIKRSGVLTVPGIYRHEDRTVRLFSLGNLLVRLLVRLRLEKNFLKVLFSLYLKLFWRQHKSEKTGE